jgi:hypothetical protein
MVREAPIIIRGIGEVCLLMDVLLVIGASEAHLWRSILGRPVAAVHSAERRVAARVTGLLERRRVSQLPPYPLRACE